MLASLLTDPDDAPDLERLLAEAGPALRPGQLLMHRARLAALEDHFDDALALALKAVQTDAEDSDALGYASIWSVREPAATHTPWSSTKDSGAPTLNRCSPITLRYRWR